MFRSQQSALARVRRYFNPAAQQIDNELCPRLCQIGAVCATQTPESLSRNLAVAGRLAEEI